MKILHIVPTYLPATRYGGPIYSVHGLCRALTRLGLEQHVFTTNIDGKNDSHVPLNRPVVLEGIHVWYFESRKMRRLYYSPDMARALNKNIINFDVTHLHAIFSWPIWQAAQKSKKHLVPYVLSPRGMLVKNIIRRKNYFLKTAWINCIERKNIESAAALHATSNIERKEIGAFRFKCRKIAVIPNGIDPTFSSEDTSQLRQDVRSLIDARKPFILNLGRLNWKKGIDRLIHAAKHFQGAMLVIAGNDEENYRKHLEKLVRSEGLAQRVRFLNYVSGYDKEMLMKSAQLFVLASYSENFGNVILEAMRVGCPVAVTREVGLSEVVENEKCGIVLTGQARDMGAQIERILGEKELLKEYGINGKRVALEKFSWDIIAKQMEKLYQEVLGDGRI